jgi:hypothetical protein
MKEGEVAPFKDNFKIVSGYCKFATPWVFLLKVPVLP